MRFDKAVFAASFVIGGTAAVSVPAAAQTPQSAPVQAGSRTLNLTREEHLTLQALQSAAAGADRVAQDSALASARAAARSADARYGVAYYQLQIALARQDAQLHAQAVDALVATNLVSGSELVPLLASQVSRAYASNEFERADRLLARMIELQPNNPVVLADYAQLKARVRDVQGAVALFERALSIQQATGQKGPESWYRRALTLAFDNRFAPQTIAFARALVTAYPSNANWRDALLSYRSVAQGDPALGLDVLRLMRAAQALAGERDYLELAQALTQAGLPAEARSVLEEGVSRGMLDSGEAVVRQQLSALATRATQARNGLARSRTQALAAAAGGPALAAGDVHFGVGQYPVAAELYQAALQKGGEDTNLVNSRLGAALALAGRRAEAETALRSVTGPRAELAAFWLAWLNRPAV